MVRSSTAGYFDRTRCVRLRQMLIWDLGYHRISRAPAESGLAHLDS
jgi:hypothetical protein